LYILMMMMDNTTRECVNVCSFSSDILCEMSKKERDGISLLSPPSFSLKKEKRTSSISDLLCFAIVYMASSTFVWCQWRLGLLKWVEVIFIPMRNNEKRWSLTTHYRNKQEKKRKKVKRLYLYNRFDQCMVSE
jgi:hypothetical protein